VYYLSIYIIISLILPGNLLKSTKKQQESVKLAETGGYIYSLKCQKKAFDKGYVLFDKFFGEVSNQPV